MPYISAFLVLCLMAIAAVVAYRIYKLKNAWSLIVAYWLVLTLKNAIDFIGGFINGF